MVELQQAEVDDVIGGLNYLKSRSFVDPSRIGVSGCSYGGIQTLLTGERDLGVKALVPFAPGAMSWEQNVPLQDLLVRAVDLARAPVFLIQAENDYSLAPSRVLTKEARKKKKELSIKGLSGFRQHPPGRALGILFFGNRGLGSRCTGLSRRADAA